LKNRWKNRRCVTLPKLDVPKYAFDEKLLRSDVPALPEIAEIDLVRHYTELSRKAKGVDNCFYPLGSCTMKYNPKLNEDVAALGGFTGIHPRQSVDTAQGILELMDKCGEALAEITGMDRISLQPAAGAHGEYTSLQLIRKYHLSRGDAKRNKIIVPDSAHGTNPASAAW
jgi:Glycine cleavage system protein P (pyridoxal-binding), C-terminal domain